MKKIINARNRAFTLIEILAALTIGSMVLLVVLALYSRAQAGASNCLAKLESHRLPREILQRIAEDLDRIAGSGQQARIDIQNKFQDGLPVAKMEILRLINDAKGQPQPLEKIVWQSSIDPDTGLLTLYRSHSGIALEDKLLDDQKEPWQRELFVPVCTGLTFFKIEVLQGGAFLDRWSNENMPPAVTVKLSFVQPYKTLSGTLDVPEEDKIIRTLAVDRTRKLPFTLAAFDVNQLFDANQMLDANQPMDDGSTLDEESSVENDQSPGLDESPDVTKPNEADGIKPPEQVRPHRPPDYHTPDRRN
ncbi:MAG: prepilin-type N-terminal cleavage/methylation domain-containing protein [Planctomycetota bacterium]